MASNSAIERLNNQRNIAEAQSQRNDGLVTHLLKKMKQMNEKKYDEITFDQIMKIVNNQKEFSEKGGFCKIEDGKPKFYVSGGGVQAYNARTGQWRQALQHNKRRLHLSGTMKWHTHPYGEGWWPSIEDLGVATDERDIIFTKYGIWIYNRKREINYEKLYQVFEFFHYDLYRRTEVLKGAKTANQFNTPFNCILDTIKYLYIPKLEECGINVYFYPGTHSTMKQDVITHITSNR